MLLLVVFYLMACASQLTQIKEPVIEEKQQPSVRDIQVSQVGDVSRIAIAGSELLPYVLYSLEEPRTLILDLPGVIIGVEKEKLINIGPVESIHWRSVSEGKVSRIEIRLKAKVQYQAKREGNSIYVDLTPVLGQELITGRQPSLRPEQVKEPEKLGTKVNARVVGLKYHFTVEQSLIDVETEGEVSVYRLIRQEDPLRLLVILEDAALKPGISPLVMGEDPDKIVKSIRIEETVQENRSRVLITIFLKQDIPYLSYQTEKAIKLAFNQPALPPPISKAGIKTEIDQKKDLSPLPIEKPPRPKVPEEKYTGSKISLDFQDADIKSVLRLLSEVSGFNIIAGDDVTGRVTTRMINVPWDLALEAILKVQGLGYEKEVNIIRVAPLGKFAQEEQERLRKKEAAEKAEELLTRVISINYADVKDLKLNLTDLLSERGKITIDERTSTMVIKDLPQNIEQIDSLINTLDKQTPQVLIEARIVEINRNFEKELGIQWGGNWEKLTNYAFPNTIQLRGGIMPQTEGIAFTPGTGIRDNRGVPALQGDPGLHPLAEPTGGGNFLLNLPAAVGLGAGGAIGFTLGHARNATFLDIQLSALENTNQGKILSSPKIATLDNREAYIQSGQTIAYQTISAEGTRTEFVDATLELRVTPHVTPDNFILMKIKASRNEPGTRNPQTGAPDITKREAYTEVLVKDGDTTVIGGIISRNIVEGVTGIPWLSKIPAIGWLFKNEAKQERNDELLIFITPRIMKTDRFRSSYIIQ